MPVLYARAQAEFDPVEYKLVGSAQVFDTFSPNAEDDLAKLIASLDDGAVVMASIYDEGTKSLTEVKAPQINPLGPSGEVPWFLWLHHRLRAPYADPAGTADPVDMLLGNWVARAGTRWGWVPSSRSAASSSATSRSASRGPVTNSTW